MLISFLRTVVLYLLLIVTVRLMGKRQIGEMEPAEFVVTMLLANLAAIPMQDSAIPLLSGLVPLHCWLGIKPSCLPTEIIHSETGFADINCTNFGEMKVLSASSNFSWSVLLYADSPC